MKIIIQIPCLNEEHTLPVTLAALPAAIPGVDVVEWLVIDDGSDDRTVEVAERLGVHHIVRHHGRKGLAAAFHTGIHACLHLGADVIVNTDGDNQYPGKYIPALVAPILSGKADLVVADRRADRNPEFSFGKRLLQRLGSATVRYVSGTHIRDAPSGFRAFSREAALRLNTFTNYTYTLETVIQAGKKNLSIAQITIETNPKLRESRLIRSSLQYVLGAVGSILRLFVLYEPLRTFTYLSVPFVLVGLVLWLRYIYFLATEVAERGAHIQSVVVGSASLIVGFLIFLIGLLADIVATSRRLQEESLYYLKRLALSQGHASGLPENSPPGEREREC